MKKKGKLFTVCVALAVAAGTLTGCGSVTGGKRIVRIPCTIRGTPGAPGAFSI